MWEPENFLGLIGFTGSGVWRFGVASGSTGLSWQAPDIPFWVRLQGRQSPDSALLQGEVMNHYEIKKLKDSPPDMKRP